MFRLILLSTVCVGLLVLGLPVVAQNAEVYPKETKASFNHNGDPVRLDHDGNPVSNLNPMPWYWHPGFAYNNVAGIKFSLCYDPYEIDILGIQPTFGNVAGAAGHFRFDPPGLTPPSEGDPVDPNILPATVSGTIWLPASIANNTGLNMDNSVVYPIFDLFYQPKHTSHYSDPRFNSDVDVMVSSLRPIFHPPGEHLNSVTVYERKHVEDPNGLHLPNSAVIPQSQSYWTKRHVASETWVVVKASQVIFPGPLAATSTIAPPSGIHVQEEHVDGWVHEEPTSEWYEMHSLVLTQFLYPVSVFVVGQILGGEHIGMGIDHIPEPVSLALLGMGVFALLIQMTIRRRRRRMA
ncbi:MAG: hypothetical protein JW829_15530 [Pirellulales bacterium]|nr:hypothetical protein [Pirellulales bacterium]